MASGHGSYGSIPSTDNTDQERTLTQYEGKLKVMIVMSGSI